ncbi:hypothetical protein [Flaviaesturariibacter aridisoli]|uniref:Uncharacterized protein n=1 Tax=Flaviaesturariibacter aridisoli TaxID=2545761 RepID=A0A4R4E6R2_9BACT|nr:hypothetical protein [Flaviaesturariibacter aridisoli]TCZ73385.1 hypothetical protein E0486_06850 [Flaviaesturariibacter aridisoli]
MIENLSNQAIPVDVQAAAATKLEELKQILAPWLFTLSAEQRAAMNRMGDRSEHFVFKGAEHAKAHPELVPGIVDARELQIDVDNVRAYRPLLQLARQLCAGLEDGFALSGAEALEATLLFYGSVKTAADKGVAGAQGIYDDMVTRFPQRGRRKKPAPATGA